MSFYKAQGAIFAKLFSIGYLFNTIGITFPDFFPVRKCLYKIPNFSQLWEPC